ncbi:MAG: DUF5320 domain-containing protein [Clostridiales bacterium]|nr:DUF5320 domain-containing protein [Clostridiales bacterium]
MQAVKDDVQGVKTDLQAVKDDVQGIKTDLQAVKDDVQAVKDDVRIVKNRVSGLELHIENVTDMNIKTVAEGHLDLSRKLDDALKVENEKEMLIIKMRFLEDELRKIKERLDQIA